jgi:hypothetical protein
MANAAHFVRNADQPRSDPEGPDYFVPIDKVVITDVIEFRRRCRIAKSPY